MHPPAPLIELAAEREPGAIVVDDELVAAAADHRMMGILHSHLQAHNAGQLEMAMYDLRVQAHQRRIHLLLDRCLDAAQALEIDVAVLKGVPIERRFYTRAGERPSSDVDLWLPPDDPHAIHALVHLLQPDHPWLDGLARMVARRQIQSVTLQVDRLEVDLHFDPLKLGIWARQADAAWQSCRTVELDDGKSIRTLDDDWTLLLLLVHLSKDRFQRLLGYADVVRVMRGSDASWQRVLDLADGEGIADLATWACAAVEQDLQVALRPRDAAGQHSGPRSWVWRWLWRPSIRLRGSEGRRRFRFRQDLLPLLAKGRQVQTLRWWLGELFPPSVAVAAEYPDELGPYLRRLTVGRWRSARSRRASSTRILPGRVDRHGVAERASPQPVEEQGTRHGIPQPKEPHR